MDCSVSEKHGRKRTLKFLYLHCLFIHSVIIIIYMMVTSIQMENVHVYVDYY